jgi:hypothetical protein
MHLRGIALLTLFFATGCATIRVTDPPRSADEQFLLTTAATRAVAQLSVEAMRDRKVWVETAFFNAPEQAFVAGEVRTKLLIGGVRLVQERKEAQIILELHSGGVGINRTEYLLGLPSLPISGGNATGTSATIGSTTVILTPELSIIKQTQQRGFAGVAYVAYWADTGEIVTKSGPFIGRTAREDWWIFGAGPRTTGNIPPTEK